MERKNSLKKAVAAGLTVAFLGSMAACSGGSAGGGGSAGSGGQSAAKQSGPTEITIAIWDADKAFGKEDTVLEAIEKKLNIKIKPENVTWDDYTQKIQLWASSGSLPDVFSGDFRNSTTFGQWANQGVVKEIPENLQKYPTLEKYLKSLGEEGKLNGKLYCIPRKTYNSQEWTAMDREIVYRWDLAKKAGITKEPENWKEFSDMIKTIIQKDPDKTGIKGLTSNDKNLLSSMFLPYASPIACDGQKWEKDKDGTYKPAYFIEDVSAAFQLARDMYDSGVIEKDIALTTNQSSRDKFLQGKSAALLIAGGYGADNYSNVAKYWKGVHKTEYTDDVKALNLMPDKNGNKSYPVWGYAWSESYINAGVNDEKLDKILSLYDYLLTDEGAFLSTYGPEGDLWNMVDGKVKLKDPNAVVSDKYPSTGALGTLVRWIPNPYDDRFPSANPPIYNDVNRKIVEQAKTVKIPEYNPKCFQIVLQDEINFTISPQDDFLVIMTGKKPVKDMWETTVNQYKQKGLDNMIKQVNEELSKEK